MQEQNFNIIDSILVEHNPFIAARKRLLHHFEASRTCAEPICLAVIGDSRSGKSRLIDHVKLKHPSERREEGMYIPILSVTVPSKPTVKGLAEKMLLALGDPLWNRRASENEKTERLIKLLSTVGTTMIVIDEFQHFYDKSSRKIQHHVADWLKTLVDRVKVALVVAGLPDCMAVISQNEQLSGRFVGAIKIPRFDWAKPTEKDEFVAILEAFQDALPEYDLPNLASDNMAFRFYCASGGLVGYIVKILRQAIWNSLFDERYTITLGDLETAFEESVWKSSSHERVNPFTLDFNPTPTIHLLDIAKTIGIADEEDEKPRTYKPKTTRQMTAAEALGG
ncbi:MAG: transposase [Betaproteobacteria bacterium HGW-Betaproteobacteria-1]|jgi:hypothetical protein|nr:MAG: transposase [Betaproteobacteria bacterium HGW-Betaproteobacteria-1]